MAVVAQPAEAKRGVVLLPCHRMMKRGITLARCRHTARDYERLSATLFGPHSLSRARLILHHFIRLMLSQ